MNKLETTKTETPLSLLRSKLNSLECLTPYASEPELRQIRDNLMVMARQSGLMATPKLDYSPHKPFPRQQAFLDLDTTEAFYGGGAGPERPMRC